MPETSYARTGDGVSLAYQVVGEGPVDVAFLPGWSGNVEIMWEYPPIAAFLRSMAAYCRLILHDRRGTGLSDRVASLPNLETRVSDLGAVLDAAGSERTTLFGTETGGAVAALFGATHPARTAGFVWYSPIARATRTADYPWGDTPEEQESYLRVAATEWGTEAFGERFVTDVDPALLADRELIHFVARMARHMVPPGSAVEMERMWYETDVRQVLGTLRTPTLTISREAWDSLDQERYVTSLIPGARHAILPGSEPFWFTGDTRPLLEQIREFLGVPSPLPELDTVLSTVLFTDIVGSTEMQASRGDHGWKELVEDHHAIVRESLERWHGVENDTAGDGFYATFDGPARAIRCALEVTERVRDLGIEIRAGVHTGECEVIEHKCGGLTVSIGARVASNAGPSEVLVSQTVKDLVAGSGLTFEDRGEHELKGVPDRWRLYAATG